MSSIYSFAKKKKKQKQRYNFADKSPSSQSYCFYSHHVWMCILKEISPEYSFKDWCWFFRFSTSATWCEELTHWKRPWCWERLKARGERDYRGWDGWMASLTRWTWVWVSSGSWWWTGKLACWSPWGRRFGHNSTTKLNWIISRVGGDGRPFSYQCGY